jgi:hypothetical protein
MATDTSEKGLETLIVRHMTGTDGLSPLAPVSTPSTDVAALVQAAVCGSSPVAKMFFKCSARVLRPLSNNSASRPDYFAFTALKGQPGC